MTDWVKYCDRVLRENGLSNWHTMLSRGRRTIGYCDYTSRTIKLSKHHLESDNSDYIVDTILHEVAHALTPGKGHGPAWRKKAIELGGTGDQYAKHSDYPSKWVTMCAKGHESKLFRWNQNTVYVCKCGAPLYIRRSDKTAINLNTAYVSRFNRLASDQGHPLIDSRGLPRL